MRIFYSLVTFLLLPFIAFSQANYQPGYVIKTTGDTLKGFLNSREWEHNPRFVEFKHTKEDRNAIKFSPLDTKGFYIEPYITYMGYVGKVQVNKNVFPDIDTFQDTTTKNDTIFLKQVFKGERVSLFTYAENYKTHFFYQEGSSTPLELNYYQYYADGGTQTVSVNRYAGQITYLFTKYNNSDLKKVSQIQQSSFNETDLTKCFKLINNSVKDKKARISNNRFFIGAGMFYTKTTFKGQNPFTGGGPGTTYAPRISMGYDVFTNPQVQRLIFRAELSFTYVKPTINGVAQSGYFAAPGTYVFNQYTVAIAPNILYNVYNTDNLKYYLGIGANFNYSLYSNNKIIFPESDFKEPFKLESLWTSFLFQTGIVINRRFEVAASYYPPVAFTRYSFFSIGNKSWGLSFKYLLDKSKK